MQGRVALVTGAAKGLGRAFSEGLLRNGAKVVLSDVDMDLGSQTFNSFNRQFGESNVAFQQCNVVSNDEMKALFQYAKSKFGKIDLVVNNAGICHETNWELMLNINLLGAIRGTYLGLEYMRKDKGGNGGNIVNIASVSGLKPTQFVPSYSASKAGLISFSNSLAANKISRTQGVRINCFCPFFVDTDIIKLKDDAVIGSKTAAKALEISGIMPIPYVVDAFVEFVSREDLNGAVLVIDSKAKKLVPQQFSTFDDIMEGSKL